MAPPTPTPPATAAPTNLKWPLAVTTVLALLGVGGTLNGGLPDLSALKLDRFELPAVRSRWSAMGVLAAVGAVVGAAHSWIRNGGVVLPRFGRDPDKSNVLVVNQFGILGDMATGVVSAIAATWTALPGPDALPPNGSILGWNVIVGAVAAAFGGARAWSGWRNQNLLLKALSITAEQPAATAEAAEKILTAPTVREAVARAVTAASALPSALPPPAPAPGPQPAAAGTPPPPGPAATTPAADPLATLFDHGRLRDQLTRLGQPLAADAAGITIDALEAFQSMRTSLRLLLAGIPVTTIADLKLDEFLANLAGMGIDVGGYRAVLGPVLAGAVAVMTELRAKPGGWSLPVGELGF